MLNLRRLGRHHTHDMKEENQSVDASDLLIMGNKIITGGSGMEGPRMKRRRQEKEVQYWLWEMGDVQRFRKLNRNM